MVLLSFKDLCLDAADPARVATFWAAALGQERELRDDGDAAVDGAHFMKMWIDRVPEPKVVKNRVHLDLRVPDIDALLELGASVVADHDGWSVLADPEGNELCAFPDDGSTPAGVPARVFAICVDSAAPVELAAWWQARLGGEGRPGPDGRPRWLDGARGLDDLILKFVAVEDERVVKNRSHWDVITEAPEADAVADLVAAGASVRRAHDDEIGWTVFADPQGNEFCLFAATS